MKLYWLVLTGYHEDHEIGGEPCVGSKNFLIDDAPSDYDAELSAEALMEMMENNQIQGFDDIISAKLFSLDKESMEEAKRENGDGLDGIKKAKIIKRWNFER